jgi:N-acyl-phosphatidylethanolamine-hydrolysing phospholipase D
MSYGGVFATPGGRGSPNPPRGWLPRHTPSIVVPRADPGYRSATWVGHSTVLLQLGGLNILTDPVWGERRHSVDRSAAADSARCRLRRLARATSFPSTQPLRPLTHPRCPPRSSFPARSGSARSTRRAADVSRREGIEERDWWQTVDGAGYTATCTPARHFSRRGLRDRGATLRVDVAADGVRVYFAGTRRSTRICRNRRAIRAVRSRDAAHGAYEPRWFMESVHANRRTRSRLPRGHLARRWRAPCKLHWGTFRLTDEPVEEPPSRFAQRWNEAAYPPAAN